MHRIHSSQKETKKKLYATFLLVAKFYESINISLIARANIAPLQDVQICILLFSTHFLPLDSEKAQKHYTQKFHHHLFVILIYAQAILQ